MPSRGNRKIASGTRLSAARAKRTPRDSRNCATGVLAAARSRAPRAIGGVVHTDKPILASSVSWFLVRSEPHPERVRDCAEVVLDTRKRGCHIDRRLCRAVRENRCNELYRFIGHRLVAKVRQSPRRRDPRAAFQASCLLPAVFCKKRMIRSATQCPAEPRPEFDNTMNAAFMKDLHRRAMKEQRLLVDGQHRCGTVAQRRNRKIISGRRIEYSRVTRNTLARTRLTPDQHERAADDAAAEHAIELGDAGRQPLARVEHDVFQRLRSARRRRAAPSCARRRLGALLDELHVRTAGAQTVGTRPGLGTGEAALLTAIHRGRARTHSPSLGLPPPPRPRSSPRSRNDRWAPSRMETRRS